MSLGVIILAGGEGKRMLSTTPKVLHKLAGTPMIVRVVNTALGISLAKQVVVVAGAHLEIIREVCESWVNSTKKLIKLYDKISWAYQACPLGTADAVIVGLSQMQPDIQQILVLSGDLPLISPSTLNTLITKVASDSIGLLTDIVVDPTGLGRIIRDEQGNFLQIIEQTELNAAQTNIKEVNVGVYLFPKTFLANNLANLSNRNRQQEYYLTDLFAADQSKLYYINTITPERSLEGFSVNTNKELADLERSYQLQQALQWLEQGVKLIDPQRFDVRGEVEIAHDVEIDVNVILEGHVHIAAGAKIGPNCYIKDSIIGQQAIIAANTVIEGATVEDFAKIGPFARVRPNTLIKTGAKVGNFVEIKSSTVGDNSKVNHISYIGNATIGKGVNIGAGTITCNYDGLHKYETVIKDNASVGASCQLIAPITIGEHAVIAAGTTLIKNAPSYQLTLNKKFQYSMQRKSVASQQPQIISTENVEKP